MTYDRSLVTAWFLERRYHHHHHHSSPPTSDHHPPPPLTGNFLRGGVVNPTPNLQSGGSGTIFIIPVTGWPSYPPRHWVATHFSRFIYVWYININTNININ